MLVKWVQVEVCRVTVEKAQLNEEQKKCLESGKEMLRDNAEMS